ncbi:MAG: energy transducer TonB [Acidobacteriota bacterium]|nr:energy transducer TonB [Acidobacteriota bacterium]
MPKAFLIILIAALGVSAQKRENFACSGKYKAEVREYFERLDEQQKFIAECEEKTRQSQIEKFGRAMPKISGECEWSNNGCPVSLIKPAFHRLAKTLKISGQVPVSVIIGEEGKVISARVPGGHPLLILPARKAACQSLFYPKTVCGRKIAHSRIIVYNFVN